MADTEAGLVVLANSLLDQLHIPAEVSSLDELTSVVLALIYEGLCGERIPDLIYKPRSHQDEVHNCQLVIDALSMDVLHTSLSHITGEDVAAGDRITLSNLLEIFSGLMEYILNKIESDVSSIDGDPGLEAEDPDALASHVIDDILQKELGRSRESVHDHSSMAKKPPTSSLNRSKTVRIGRDRSPERLRRVENSTTVKAPAVWATSTAEDNGQFLAAQDRYVTKGRGTPPDEADAGRRLETTDSLIREGELLERQFRSPVREGRVSPHNVEDEDKTPDLAPPVRSLRGQGRFDHVGMKASARSDTVPQRETRHSAPQGSTDLTGGRPHTYTHHLYHHYSDPRSGVQGLGRAGADVVTGTEAVLKTAPLSTDTLFSDSARATSLGCAQSAETRQRSAAPEPRKDRFHTADVRRKPPLYDSLKAALEQTVQMSRDAVSPERRKLLQENFLSEDIRHKLSRIEAESSEIRELAASLNLPQTAGERGLSQSWGAASGSASLPQSPNRVQRKVSFLVDEGETEPDSTPESPVKSSLRRYYEERYRRKQAAEDSRREQTASRVHSAAALTRLSRGYGSDGDLDILPEGLSSPEYSPVRLPASKNNGGMVSVPRFGDLLAEDLTAAGGRQRPTQKKKKTDVNVRRKKGSVDAIKDTRGFVQKEDSKARRKADYLRLLYEHELEDFKDDLKEQRASEKTKTESEYKKKIHGSKPKVTTGKKTITGKKTGVVTGKAVSRLGRTKAKQRRRSASASPTVGRTIASSTIEPENNLFSLLYQEFPYLYLSPDTWHELWRQGIQQIERLTRAQQTAQTRKNRGIAQLEEAEDRQKILMNIMRKEQAHSQRMRDLKLKRDQEASLKNKLHEKRMQSAKSRKYYNEYQIQSRAKMLKRRTKEELLFKKLFRDGLEIQKDRIKELRRYAKEQREIQSKERQNDIDSLENYYRDQFEMLADSVTREREEQQMREKAQTKVLEQMKRELRKKMEREIEDFQEQLFRDDDDLYFRQLDADRLREELRVAKYHVKV